MWLFILLVFAKLIYKCYAAVQQNGGGPYLFSASSIGEFPLNSICGVADYRISCSELWYKILNKQINQKFLEISKLDENLVLQEAIFFDTPLKVLKKDKLLFQFEQNVRLLSLSNTSTELIESNAFDKFVKLKVLQLRHNLLTSIDTNILTQRLGSTLILLDLSFNNFKNFSMDTFEYLTNLETLTIAGNENILPDSEIFPESLSNLKELYLGGCNITFLNDEIFKNLKNLEMIELTNNPLKIIPAAINLLPNLKSLVFAITEIEELKYSSNVKNDNLESINLLYSKSLKKVDDCAFCNFPKLQNISFKYCTNLENIHENAFGSLTLSKPLKIKTLNIEACKISVLHENLFNWKAADSLEIRDNFFACNDPRNAWLIKDLRKNKEKWNKMFEEFYYTVDDVKCIS